MYQYLFNVTWEGKARGWLLGCGGESKEKEKILPDVEKKNKKTQEKQIRLSNC